MVPTLSYTNMSISIVFALGQKNALIVYQQIVEICCEVMTFYCCTKYSLSISELQEHASSHCSLLWYTKGIGYQQNYWCRIIKLYSFTKFCIQIIKVQELACHSVMYGPILFCGFPKN